MKIRKRKKKPVYSAKPSQPDPAVAYAILCDTAADGKPVSRQVMTEAREKLFK